MASVGYQSDKLIEEEKLPSGTWRITWEPLDLVVEVASRKQALVDLTLAFADSLGAMDEETRVTWVKSNMARAIFPDDASCALLDSDE